MTAFQVAISIIELVVCTYVALVLALRWRAHRSTTTSAACGIFAAFAVVLAVSFWEPAEPDQGVAAAVGTAVLCILLALPYLLARFAWALGRIGATTHRALAGLLAVEVALTVALPPLPEDGAPQPAWATAYIVFVLAAWTLQSVLAARGLWRGGAGQSAVVRHRMRSLASGAVLLALTLVLSAAVGDDAPEALQGAVSLLGLVSILLFALAFLVPAPLRLIWRQQDVAALSVAERGLMAALTRAQIAETIVPVLAGVFGGAGATLYDERGAVVRTSGTDDDVARRTGLRLAELPPSSEVRAVDDGALVAGMTRGWLVVHSGQMAPVFGDDEAVLLGRAATLVDLALQRAILFEQERASRHQAESANADLETLLYSVSHDLRSPLISVLGYLDVLRQEHAGELAGEGPHYLDRISVNALYMQSLIADLLELSRIGRSDPPPDRVDLRTLAEQVADGALLHRPKAAVRVGELPVVLMTDVRARQLLTNLIDNALKHGGRDDLTVTVAAADGPDGEVLVQVADDGVGIPVEYRDRVLRVFERLDAPKSSPGTGMGLAICKRIAESFGGSLSVGGPPAGATSGTTLSVVLPPSVRVTPVPSPRRPRSGVPAHTEDMS